MDCNVRGVAKSWTLLSDFPFQQVLLFTTDFFLLLIFFFNLLATFLCMWDFSSLTRDRTLTPAAEAWSLNHWTIREVPVTDFMEGGPSRGITVQHQNNLQLNQRPHRVYHLLSILGSAHQPATSSGPDLMPFLAACLPTPSPVPPSS